MKSFKISDVEGGESCFYFIYFVGPPVAASGSPVDPSTLLLPEAVKSYFSFYGGSVFIQPKYVTPSNALLNGC